MTLLSGYFHFRDMIFTLPLPPYYIAAKSMAGSGSGLPAKLPGSCGATHGIPKACGRKHATGSLLSPEEKRIHAVRFWFDT